MEVSFRGGGRACSRCLSGMLDCFRVANISPGCKRLPPMMAVAGAVGRTFRTSCGEARSIVGVLHGVRAGGVSPVLRTLSNIPGRKRTERRVTRGRRRSKPSRVRVCELIRVGRRRRALVERGARRVDHLGRTVTGLRGMGSAVIPRLVSLIRRLLSSGVLRGSDGRGCVLAERRQTRLFRGVEEGTCM